MIRFHRFFLKDQSIYDPLFKENKIKIPQLPNSDESDFVENYTV